ncbi:unnamed protein product [Eruca vesicaria subsp. sativa]|uniref:Uncharacterized protein n=1 Tax=Eruca vesicaria subsp. sativa TaxID=29727 RepID=A0ABC8IMD5_ERUVS|nr:unnamed protein product [Eruca vesicaria subsp. sativa]
MDPIKPQPFKFRHVVAMPWPGRGHINPMMNLCKRLVRRDPNLHVTYVVTEEWLGFIGSDPKPHQIHFSTLPNLIPSELVRAKITTRWRTYPLTDTNRWRLNGHKSRAESKEDEIVDYIPGLSPTRLRDLSEIFHGYVYQSFIKFKPCYDDISKANYLLFPSTYELEPIAIDFFTSKFRFPVYSTGPLIPFQELNDGEKPDYIRWLDEQPEGSVLYISQGSFLSVTEAQMEEIMEGVRDSGVRFLWVARGLDSRLKEALEGSLGVVVSWCDQLRVLCHAAVGGFWTHCGYNSTLEGMYSGVPMLTFPLVWDQFLNAKMIVEEWRIGMRMKSKKSTAEMLIRRDEVKELVKRFMDGESEEGKGMRRRACDLSEICRGAVAKAGSSDVNIDAFIKDITMIV